MSSSNKDNKTVAEIAKEMLKVAAFHTAGDQVSDSLAEIPIDDYADRIEVAHDREIKALEWKIENYAKVVECKDREIKAKDAKIEELREKWHEALNIADCVEKRASIERQTEAMFKKNEVICGLRKQIAELRECLEDACMFHCEKRYLKVLEGADNEVE